VKVSAVVVKSDDIEFFDWSLHNFCAYFWSCDHIGKCPMLKVAIERAIKKSPHYDLAGNLFNVDHGICKHQFVGFVSSYTRSNVLTLFHLHSFVTFLHGFRLQYCCNLLIDYKTSYSFQHAGLSYAVITIDAILED
jgi:hypothetical protein